jgi:uncharacterized protein YqgC (DUF456 family)
MAGTIALWILAAFMIIGGLAGLVLPALPGAPLLFAGLLIAAWAEDFAYVGGGALLALGLLALLIVLVDVIAGMVGAKRYGASSRAVAGAAIGAVVGLFMGFIGILIGPFVGAVIGELSARRNLSAAARAGWGTTIGLVFGVAAKLALGFTMVGAFVIMRVF